MVVFTCQVFLQKIIMIICNNMDGMPVAQVHSLDDLRWVWPWGAGDMRLRLAAGRTLNGERKTKGELKNPAKNKKANIAKTS